MADETPEQPKPTEEESKKDTVRINLPPGLTGRSSAPISGGGAPPPPAKTKAPPPPVSPEDEAKRETAVMGRPAETPKPKKDTSRVQVSAAKPAVPETPRPTVKLRREEQEEPPAGTHAATLAAAAPKVAAVAAPSGGDTVLSLLAMLLSIAVAAYLGLQAFGIL